MAAFAVLVRRARQAAWMTQEELAERSGLSPRTIQAIERGQVARPHRESVRLLAKALELHGSTLVEFEAAARRGGRVEDDTCGCATDLCPTLAGVAGCLARQLRGSAVRVDLRGLGHAADALTVLYRLLHAAGVEAGDYEGFAGSPVSSHTLPVQMLPGA